MLTCSWTTCAILLLSKRTVAISPTEQQSRRSRATGSTASSYTSRWRTAAKKARCSVAAPSSRKACTRPTFPRVGMRLRPTADPSSKDTKTYRPTADSTRTGPSQSSAWATPVSRPQMPSLRIRSSCTCILAACARRCRLWLGRPDVSNSHQ